jgi:predicted patatin/cPLA2 family phospholipase
MFLEAGLDIRGKVLSDAKMPLYIITSNITKGIPAIFSKNVSVLEALKCSCCLPGLFRPQELYGQLYVDGGVFTPCVSIHVSDGLCITLKKKQRTRISPKSLHRVNPLTYIHELYDMSMNYIHEIQKTENTLSLMYPNLHTESNLDELDVDAILEHSRSSMRNFLASKGGL